jgi:hypothetical protein
MNAQDRKIREDIENFGCSVMHIAEEGDLPPFGFSVGITQSSGAPEVIVVGLKQPIAHFVVNEYNRRVRAGASFSTAQRSSGFIEGFDVIFLQVDPSNYREYLGYNLWLYDGPNFEVLQIVFPSTSGVWPWEDKADNWFKSRQPILGKSLPSTEA